MHAGIQFKYSFVVCLSAHQNVHIHKLKYFRYSNLAVLLDGFRQMSNEVLEIQQA